MIISVCGKPSVGKSTFFKAATLAEVEIAPHPFTTIKSQEGIAFVKIPCADKDFNVQCNPRYGYCINHNRFVPIKLFDIPGLIENAHLGEGLGLEFLNDIREADALIHIIDISGSTDEKGNQVPPLSHDPAKDVKFLENELDYWYLSVLKKGWEKFVRNLKQENLNIKQALAKQLSGLKVTEEIVESSIKKLKLLHHPSEWSEDDLFNLAKELRKITKPMIIAANKIDVEGSELYLDILNYAVFELLKYVAVFPGGLNKLQDSEGRVLPDCFLLPENSTALDFAFKLHTDIGNSFVKAINVRTKQAIGKEHLLKNLDVIEIKTSK